jgi:hypothetical protein
MEVTQKTKLEINDFSNTAVIVMEDEYNKYPPVPYKYVAHNLAMALEIAEVCLENECDLIMDDINKFPCANPCHMERGAMMKAFFLTIYRHNQKLFLRTDEISESLDLLIKKVFL